MKDVKIMSFMIYWGTDGTFLMNSYGDLANVDLQSRPSKDALTVLFRQRLDDNERVADEGSALSKEELEKLED